MWKMRHLLVCFSVIAFISMGTITAWAAGEKVNINTASAEELTKLQQIGPKKADQIVAYRNANGPFQKPEDLKNVSGIGDKIFEMNQHMIVISDMPATVTPSPEKKADKPAMQKESTTSSGKNQSSTGTGSGKQSHTSN